MYKTKDDLPKGVKDNLPKHAQDIYKEAYNAALDEHGSEANSEQIAHKIAWSAVKKSYEKVEGEWRAAD